MSDRKALNGSDDMKTMAVKMAEGTPGALRVILELFNEPRGHIALLDLDDMNIRGSQIWVCYKDVCGEDIAKLMEGARNRDAAFVEQCNKECPDHTAVSSGASFARGRTRQEQSDE